MEYSNIFVCLLGLGTVFVGLICIILICNIMGAICKKKASDPAKLPEAPASLPAENRQEVIAAISAALAENLGTDVSGIRILSVKKL